MNGDVAEGNFQSGQPHGKIKYIFGQTTDSKKVVGVHKKRWYALFDSNLNNHCVALIFCPALTNNTGQSMYSEIAFDG